TRRAAAPGAVPDGSRDPCAIRRSGGTVAALDLALGGLVAQRPALVGCRVLDHAVHLSALVVGGQVLGDRQTLRRDEQQTVAVLVDLHVVAGTDPGAVLILGLLAGVEAPGPQRPPQGVAVHRQSFDHRFGDLGVWMRRRPRFLAVTGHELLHPLDALVRRFGLTH